MEPAARPSISMHELSRPTTAPGPKHTTRVPSATGSLPYDSDCSACHSRPAAVVHRLSDSPPQGSMPTCFRQNRAGVGPGMFRRATPPFNHEDWTLCPNMIYAVMVTFTVGICRWDQWCHLRPYPQQAASRDTISSPSSPSSHSGCEGGSLCSFNFHESISHWPFRWWCRY